MICLFFFPFGSLLLNEQLPLIQLQFRFIVSESIHTYFVFTSGISDSIALYKLV